MDDLTTTTRNQVQSWARELIDLTRNNTTLYFKPTKRSTLEIVSPSLEELVALLRKPGPLDFFYPPEPPGDEVDEHGEQPPPWTVEDSKEQARAEQLVTDRTAGSDVRANLRNLARRAESDHLDRGVQSLYLCLGVLQWREVEGQWNRSPLVFVPVQLERPSAREPYRLTTAGDEALLNPALRVLFDEQFGIELADLDIDLEEETVLDSVFSHLRTVIGEHPWRIESTATLKRATFHKEAMYQDLFANADAVAQHPLVQTLAVPGAGADLAESAEVPGEEEVDEAAPPEKAHLILDADASQRRAIAAATAGASIVMDGPPGTGKSQTIANLIAELLARGRKVLFVSEKSAALDVVANRLADVGLDDFLLELHDHRTKRREAAHDLGRALRSHPRIDPGRRDIDAARAANVRHRLSSYAEAVNKIREPLGRSAHWVLGRLSQLHHSPRLTLGPVDSELSAEQAAELDEAFERLGRRWRPAVAAEAMLWHSLHSDHPPQEQLTWLADELHKALEETSAAAEDLALACGLDQPRTSDDARRALSVASHCVNQPWTARAWWQRRDLADLRAALLRLRHLQQEHATVREPLEHAYPDGGAALDPSWIPRLSSAMDQLGAVHPAVRLGEQADQDTVEAQRSAAKRVVELAGQADGLEREISSALSAPSRRRGLEHARALADVAEYADAPNRPEASWVTPAVARQAEQAINELQPLQEHYARWVAALRDVFTADVLKLDLRGLTRRFSNNHKGLRKLSSAYRADKKQVAQVTRSGQVTREVLARLESALACQDSAAHLDAAERRHAELLGKFAAPRENRLAEARAALAVISWAQHRLGDDYNPDGIAAQLCGRQPAELQLGTKAVRLNALISQLHEAATALAGEPASVEQLSASELRDWAATVEDACDRLTDLLGRVNQSRRQPTTLAEAKTELGHRAHLDQVEATLAETAPTDRGDLEAAYQGLDTDTSAVDEALQWVEELQRRYGGPLPTSAVDALHKDGPALDPLVLEHALARVDANRAQLTAAFVERRAAELNAELSGHFRDAVGCAEALASRAGEIGEWRAYSNARQAVEGLGWGPQLTEAQARRVDPTHLTDALRRSMWAGWLESVTASEPDLLAARADDLDAWVREFRELDKAVLGSAAERVVERCNAQRPRGSHGASSIIEREANKKRRHMPIRDLLGKTDEVAKALKPCFMMSPLTVSQFLPSDFTFDVVIFDEASQVTPADAVNCIYRGQQLVVTGDDKQLPPTNFFDLAALDGDSDDYEEGQLDEFESIITQCKSAAGMPSLPLRWHYRSQHEDLITFSNYNYYAPDNQRLHTFPGARIAGEDLGVHLFQIDGVYRRGGPRDNPIEADHVAERVRQHAERILSQPSERRETVGVVAFSVSQADAIEHRIDQLRDDHPELEEFFAADRLDGFFVKNLENVQGDERDIMIFSVGYGPDENGRFTSHFGPLSGVHGHRRLNVAITRARRRVEVLCSFAPSQLDSRKATHRGVPDLKRYLEYATQGIAALGIDLHGSEGDVESPFEESVLHVIRGWGYQVVPQVGAAGYRIDLAVRDPNQPDRYAIGIECDGRAYHSTRVARDRDRLRAEVLQRLGWTLHRIWGPAWYRDRDREMERLRHAVDEAIDGGAPRSQPAERRHVERANDAVEPLDTTLEEPDWVQPYEPLLPRVPQHDHPADPGAFTENVQIVREILKQEAPMHIELLSRRVADTYERSLTNRVRTAVSDAVLTLRRQSRCEQQGDWVRLRGDDEGELAVRVPTDDPDSHRDVEHIPPEELQAALARLVEDAQLIDEEELLVAVARLFGVGRTTQRMRATLQAALDRLLTAGQLERNSNEMIRPSAHPRQ